MNDESLRLESIGRYWKALDDIWKIVHTPTKKTNHRSAEDHFQADFDAIRRIIANALASSHSSKERE